MIIFETEKSFREIIDLRFLDRFKFHEYIQIAMQHFMCFLLFFTFFISLMNFIVNVSDDVQKAWPSLAPFFGYSASIVVHRYLITYREDFYSLFECMWSFVEKRQSSHENYTLYEEAQQRACFWKKVCTSVFLAPIAFLSPFVRVAYHWWLGIYSVESWFFLFPIWTPFQLNFSWCALIVLLAFAGSICISQLYFVIVCLFIEISVYTGAFIKDIKDVFDRVEGCKVAIDLHNRTYEFVNLFANTTHLLVLVLVGNYALAIISSLLIILKYAGEWTLLDFQMPILVALFALQSLFIFFYIGQIIHSDLRGLSDMLYQSDWYRYPCSVQRCMLVMMIRAQQPFYVGAYGVARCTLENYLRVLNGIYSSLALFRSID